MVAPRSQNDTARDTKMGASKTYLGQLRQHHFIFGRRAAGPPEVIGTRFFRPAVDCK